MNILVETLPIAIEIDGHDYEINADFRSCLRIILAFEDPELATIEKQAILLENLYKEQPENIAMAFEQGIKFLNGGEDNQGDGPSLRLYSFDHDAQFIMAAFQQTHGIDLETIDMHWWKFMALFMDLGSETTFTSLMGLRKKLKTGKASKEERKAAAEMSEIVKLPDISIRSLEEREAEARFRELVKRGKEKRHACQNA